MDSKEGVGPAYRSLGQRSENIVRICWEQSIIKYVLNEQTKPLFLRKQYHKGRHFLYLSTFKGYSRRASFFLLDRLFKSFREDVGGIETRLQR